MITLPLVHCGINDVGWLVGPHDERFFWVPLQLRNGIERPGVRIIGRCERTTLDTSRLVYGEEWTRVRDGGRLLGDFEEMASGSRSSVILGVDCF